MSPPGRTNGSVWNGSPRPMARTMSMREMIVPCSPTAHRTKAKMLFGAKPTTLRRRSRICSWHFRPKRIQCSTFCFWNVSSTNVVKGAGPSGCGRPCARCARRLIVRPARRASADVRETRGRASARAWIYARRSRSSLAGPRPCRGLGRRSCDRSGRSRRCDVSLSVRSDMPRKRAASFVRSKRGGSPASGLVMDHLRFVRTRLSVATAGCGEPWRGTGGA